MSSRADKPVADRFQNPAHGGENGFQNRLSGTGNATVAKGIEGVSEPPGNLLENPSEKNGGRTALATAERRAHPTDPNRWSDGPWREDNTAALVHGGRRTGRGVEATAQGEGHVGPPQSRAERWAVAEIASYYAMSRSRTPSTPAFIRGL